MVVMMAVVIIIGQGGRGGVAIAITVPLAVVPIVPLALLAPLVVIVST